MHYNELEKGMAAPASLRRKNGARYLWEKNQTIYVQSGPDFSRLWVAESPFEFKVNEEVFTGELWVDGKPIYRKLLVGTSFTVGGSYGRVPHEVSTVDTLISASGYVGTPGAEQYATYANYIDPTNFFWFWTGGGGFPYHFWITYTKN